MSVTVIPRIDSESVLQDSDTHFGVYEVPETSSSYRVLIRRLGPHQVAISLLNWGTSAEFGSLPTRSDSAYSIAEHLAGGNLIDGENLVEVFRLIDDSWPAEADDPPQRVHLHRDDYPQTLRLLEDLLGPPLRRGQGGELGFEPTEHGAYVNWDLMLDSWLSTTEKAVAHIARGAAVLERAGGPAPRLGPVTAGVMLNVCQVGR